MVTSLLQYSARPLRSLVLLIVLTSCASMGDPKLSAPSGRTASAPATGTATGGGFGGSVGAGLGFLTGGATSGGLGAAIGAAVGAGPRPPQSAPSTAATPAPPAPTAPAPASPPAPADDDCVSHPGLCDPPPRLTSPGEPAPTPAPPPASAPSPPPPALPSPRPEELMARRVRQERLARNPQRQAPPRQDVQAPQSQAGPRPEEATPTPPDPEWVLAIERAYSNLKRAWIAFNAPDTIEFDETVGIELLLSLTEPPATLQSQLTAIGKKHGYEIRAASQMEATLRPVRDSVFKVVAITPETQTLRAIERTRWAWRVTPLDWGKQELQLTVSAVYQVDGHDAKRALRTFQHNITIQVSPWKYAKVFLKKNWQWAWTTLLIPVVGWVGWTVKRARQKPQFEG